MPAGNPFQQHALRSSQRQWREGDVIQRVAAGPYVYLHLREPNGQLACLVSLHATTPAARHVRALVVGRAEHFESQRMGRSFSPLLFAAVRRAAASARVERVLMATTYLQLQPDKAARFQELVGPVVADIQKRSGLAAYAFGNWTGDRAAATWDAAAEHLATTHRRMY